MISFLLLQQIAKLFLILLLGFLLVRFRLLKSEDSRVLSVVTLYLVVPCTIVNSFQIEFTRDRVQGMLLSFGTAILIHAIYITLTHCLRRPLCLTPVEQASAIYSNTGNLVIPLVLAILGSEWVIYSSMFVIVQQPLFWSHCRILVSGEREVSWKKVLLNVNILSVLVGAALFFLQIPIPSIVKEAMSSVSSMIGPICMIVAGMLMGNVDFKAVLCRPGVWKVAALRLLAYPLLILSILKFTSLSALAPNGETILLISLLAAGTPTAFTVTQLAQIYDKDGEYAGAINVVTTLLCLVTIPALAALYQL